MVASYLNDRTYTLVDELEKIAKAHDSTVARIALAWVRQRPGVTSTIIGARRVSQLEDNLKSLAITLSYDEITYLDSLSKPDSPSRRACSPFFRQFKTAERQSTAWREELRSS